MGTGTVDGDGPLPLFFIGGQPLGTTTGDNHWGQPLGTDLCAIVLLAPQATGDGSLRFGLLPTFTDRRQREHGSAELAASVQSFYIGKMRRVVVSSLVYLLLTSGSSLAQVTRIDRTNEVIEDMMRRENGQNQEILLTELAYEARRSAYQVVIFAEQALLLTQSLEGESPPSEKEFEKGFKEKMKEIRTSIKAVLVLADLDPNENDQTSKYERAEGFAPFLKQTEDLRQLTVDLRNRVDSFFGLVEVEQFEGPSLKALTKNIENLAKTLSKACSRI